MRLYNFHLAIEVYNFKFRRSPKNPEGRIGALYTPKSGKADSSPEAEKVFKDPKKPLEQRPVSRLIMPVSFSFLH